MDTATDVTALNRVLGSLGIKAECTAVNRVRNIANYDLTLKDGGRVREVEKFSQEIGLALKSRSAPLVKPILSQGIVRLQIVESDPPILDFYTQLEASPRPEGILPFYLGETADDKALWLDFHTNPHLLIAGASGSGKSTLLHAIVANALLPHEYYLNVCLMDTKQIELAPYGRLGLENVRVDTTYDQVVDTLKTVHASMEETYRMMRELNLPSNYYGLPGAKGAYHLIVIDEFADLIMQDSSGEFYELVCQLAQKGRAAGIHFVIATQRPSVDILRGTIKANFPARIACRVSSRVDSNVILDSPQAHSLMGRGDALIRSGNLDLVRFQVAYATQERNIEHRTLQLDS